MEREASYLTVGAFVLLVLALGTWFVAEAYKDLAVGSRYSKSGHYVVYN